MVRSGLVCLLLAAAALTLTGCGGDEQSATTPAPTEAAAADVAVPVTPPGNPVIEALELNDWYRAILVDRAAIADPHELEAIARPYCEGLAVCRAAIWFNAAALPRAMPVDADAVEVQAFALGRTANGTENVLWNCNLFPQFADEQACLPRVFR